MREIHDAHHAEDDAEADAHQAVSAADQKSRGEHLQEIHDTPIEIVHSSFSLGTGQPLSGRFGKGR